MFDGFQSVCICVGLPMAWSLFCHCKMFHLLGSFFCHNLCPLLWTWSVRVFSITKNNTSHTHIGGAHFNLWSQKCYILITLTVVLYCVMLTIRISHILLDDTNKTCRDVELTACSKSVDMPILSSTSASGIWRFSHTCCRHFSSIYRWTTTELFSPEGDQILNINTFLKLQESEIKWLQW